MILSTDQPLGLSVDSKLKALNSLYCMGNRQRQLGEIQKLHLPIFTLKTIDLMTLINYIMGNQCTQMGRLLYSIIMHSFKSACGVTTYRFSMQAWCTDCVCDVAHGRHGPSLYLGGLWRNEIHHHVITTV